MGMGGWKIRTAKTSHNENCSLFFAMHLLPWFLPSLSSLIPSHFCPCRWAHIPHERGGASCRWHWWWEETTWHDHEVVWVCECDHVWTWSHDMLTCWTFKFNFFKFNSTFPPTFPPTFIHPTPPPTVKHYTSRHRHLLHPCAPPSKDVGRVRNCQHIPPQPRR